MSYGVSPLETIKGWSMLAKHSGPEAPPQLLALADEVIE
jgi:hypothetical protein